MKRILLPKLIPFLLLLISYAYAQEGQILQTSEPLNVKTFHLFEDGTYLLGGGQKPAVNAMYSDTKPVLVKWHPETGAEWAKLYDIQGLNIIQTMEVLENGDIIAGGGSMTESYFLLLLGPNGKLKKKIELPIPGTVYDLHAEEDGYVLGGYFDDQYAKIGAMKIDPDGEVLWKWTLNREDYANPIDHYVKKIIPVEEGYYFAGSDKRVNFMASANKKGLPRWKVLVSNEYSDTYDCILHSSGNLWLTGKGYHESGDPEPEGGVYVACVSQSGEIQWKRHFESKKSASGEGLVELEDGTVAMLSRHTRTGIKAGLYHLDAEGKQLSHQKTYEELTQIFGLHKTGENTFSWFQVDNINSHTPENRYMTQTLK